MKRTPIAVTALVLAGTLTACGGDDAPQADPTPTQSPTTSAPTAAPSAVSTPGPTWDDTFSPVQLKRYRAARDRWVEYWEFYTDIAGKGVDTPRVKAGFEKYTMYPIGEHSQFLDSYVRGGIRMEVPPEVLWTSAEKITTNRVDLNYCVDSTNSRTVHVSGDVAPKPKPRRRLITVQMVKVNGWRTLGYPHTEEVRPCGKTAP